jgi:hypothetical protein
MPMHLFLDSSTVRAELPIGRVMSALARLSANGVVAVHVPEVVVGEVWSQNLSQIQQAERELQRVLPWLPNRLRTEMTALAELLSQHTKEREQVAKDGVEDWLRRLGAIRDDLHGTMAAEVFELYFRGEPPFKQIKNRNDIPDGFIYVTIRAFSQSASEPVHVAAADKALREACARLSGVIVHESLPQFLALPQLERIFLSNPGEIRQYCKENKSELVERLRPLVREAARGGEFKGELFQEYYGYASIVEVRSVSCFSFDFADASPLGENTLGIPFWCLLEGVRAETENNIGIGPIVLDQEFDVGVEVWASVQVLTDQHGRLSFGNIEVERLHDFKLRGGAQFS